ncbi:Trm112 family protein [Aquisalimonas lutea]|uniref:Trm112 family protein n=1 Tax=Aquisalimonas lutea TaxID=1327750 RepID=UPI0025B28901|nr:Trm112 family protein [Aquisalimonas lutea]MDN3516024.1 Trm112 family protein [Aquisalimonas lutea]
MAVDRKLLEILCCPVTKVPVEPLPRERLDALNALVEQGQALYQDGTPVTGPVTEALITENGERIYLVEDGIPVMLEERALTARGLGWI